MKRNTRGVTVVTLIVCFALGTLIWQGLDKVDAAPEERGSSMKGYGEKPKILSSEEEPKVFRVDEKAIVQLQKRLELIHLTNLLENPTALAARIALKKPKREANKIINDMVSRRKKLIKDLINESKNLLSSEEKLFTKRVFYGPPPPPGDDIGKLDSLSLRDALEDMGFLKPDALRERHLQQLRERACDIRQGEIAVPESFRVLKDLVGSADAMGNIAYSLDDGVLPFRSHIHDVDGESIDFYIMGAELAFRFPAPLCDSTLTWEYELGAGASIICGAEGCGLYLDHYMLEQPDVGQEPETLTIMVAAGALLDLNESTAWDEIDPVKVSGSFEVPARTESRIWILTLASIWAQDGLAITDGQFQVFTELARFSPGVRYRFDPL